jgi:hypothetical protein
MVHKSKKYFSYKKHYMTALLVLLALALITTLELTNTTHIFHKQNAPTGTIPKSSSSKPTSTGNKTTSTNTSINKGTATDNNGVSPVVTTDSSKWIVSSSGLLTVKSPLENDKIATGVSLTGIASVDQIQYRLVDDQVGVISQGFINVVDGTFSANISFVTHSTTGRLDVFSTDSGGREINEVQIQVTF